MTEERGKKKKGRIKEKSPQGGWERRKKTNTGHSPVISISPLPRGQRKGTLKKGKALLHLRIKKKRGEKKGGSFSFLSYLPSRARRKEKEMGRPADRGGGEERKKKKGTVIFLSISYTSSPGEKRKRNLKVRPPTVGVPMLPLLLNLKKRKRKVRASFEMEEGEKGGDLPYQLPSFYSYRLGKEGKGGEGDRKKKDRAKGREKGERGGKEGEEGKGRHCRAHFSARAKPVQRGRRE